MKLDQWDDKTSGHKRQRLGVVGEIVQFLGGKPDGQRAAPPTTGKTASEIVKEKTAGETNDDSDVPF